MQASTEARWFFHEREKVTAIEKWFAGFQLKLNTVNFERRDYYLKLPGVTSLGLKIREPKPDANGKWQGKLEAKVLIKNIDIPKLKQGYSGYANQWTKFSFSLPAGESTLVEILDDFSVAGNLQDGEDRSQWIELKKNRVVVEYDVEKKECSVGVRAIPEGCGIELTALQINGVLKYSFGLEAFSNSGKQEENFFETLNYVFNEIKVEGLSVENSLSYPQFLALEV